MRDDLKKGCASNRRCAYYWENTVVCSLWINFALRCILRVIRLYLSSRWARCSILWGELLSRQLLLLMSAYIPVGISRVWICGTMWLYAAGVPNQSANEATAILYTTSTLLANSLHLLAYVAQIFAQASDFQGCLHMGLWSSYDLAYHIVPYTSAGREGTTPRRSLFTSKEESLIISNIVWWCS